MATNSGGWLYEATGTPVDKATADNAQARVLEIKQTAQDAEDAVLAIKGPMDGRLSALEVLGGLAPGSPTDATMTDIALQPDSMFGGALTSKSVEAIGGRLLFTDDPGVSVPDGTLVALYQGSRQWVERFNDGLYGLTPRWARRDQWTWADGAATIPAVTGLPGRRGLSIDALGSNERDVELLARVNAAATATAVNTGLFLRGSGTEDSNSSFAVCLRAGGFWVISYTPSGATVLSDQNINRRTGVDCMIRFRATDRLQAKVWHADETEPTAWQYDDIIVGNKAPGWAGMFSNVSTSAFAQKYLEIAVATQGETAVFA